VDKLGVGLVGSLLHFALGEAQKLNSVLAPAATNTVCLLVELFVRVGFGIVGWLVLVQLGEDGVSADKTLEKQFIYKNLLNQFSYVDFLIKITGVKI